MPTVQIHPSRTFTVVPNLTFPLTPTNTKPMYKTTNSKFKQVLQMYKNYLKFDPVKHIFDTFITDR